MKPAEKAKIKEDACQELKRMLPVGSTVYTGLKHVSRSGMMRHIEMYIVEGSEIRWLWPYKCEEAGLGYTRAPQDGGWKVGGCGMDMGFSLVNSLSYLVWGDGYPCIGKGCPSAFHQGKNYENYTDEVMHKDGYALRQKWLS